MLKFKNIFLVNFDLQIVILTVSRQKDYMVSAHNLVKLNI